MKLTGVLGASSEASFDIKLNDNSLVRKWTDELRWCLAHRTYDQEEAFSTFLTDEELTQKIFQCATTINQFLGREYIDMSCFNPKLTQNNLNTLHSYFEELNGLAGIPSKVAQVQDPALARARRGLNFYIHGLEVARNNGRQILLMNFNSDSHWRRYRLEPEDYEFAEYTYRPGTLLMPYAEVGKHYQALFNNNLPIDYPAARNYHYYSGNATLVFNSYDLSKKTEYMKWLTDNGIDPYDKKVGHLFTPLGYVDEAEVDTIKSNIKKYKYINTILIKEN